MKGEIAHEPRITRMDTDLDALGRSGYACGVKMTEDPVKWGKHLAARVEAIVRLHPEADPDTIRLTLMALELTPEERLRRSLRRGRGFATFRSRA